VIVVGDEIKTGDGTQAWASTADLVLNTRDAANATPSSPTRTRGAATSRRGPSRP
jgi:hypothetical protein